MKPRLRERGAWPFRGSFRGPSHFLAVLLKYDQRPSRFRGRGVSRKAGWAGRPVRISPGRDGPGRKATSCKGANQRPSFLETYVLF